MIRQALAFAAALGALAAHAEPISFEGGTTAVGEITPGGTSVWMVASTFSMPDGSHGTAYRNAIVADDDNDGIVRWQFPSPFGVGDGLGGLWTMTEVAAGAIHAVRGNGDAALPDPLPSDFLGRDPAGTYGYVIVDTLFSDTVDVLWIRPGAGAWRGRGADGGPNDLDGADNNFEITFPLAQLNAISDGSPAPQAVVPGDILVVMMTTNDKDFRWLGAALTQTHFDNARTVGNTPAEIGFGEYNARFRERSGSLTLEVQRAGNWSTTSTVQYESFDRDGIANIQFVPVSGSITFPPGETTKTIEVPLLDDEAYAGAVMNFQILLKNATAAMLDEIRSVASIFISEDDPLPNFFIPPLATKEGDTRTKVPFAITMDGAIAKPFDLRWNCFGCFNGFVQFQPGDTQRNAELEFEANTDVDGDRTHTIEFRSPFNSLFPLATSTLTIQDDDAPSMSIAIDDVTVIEGTGAAKTRVRVSPAANTDFDLRLRTHAITADAADFTAQDMRVVIAKGATEIEIAIPISDDEVIEDDETFAIALSDASVLNVVFADAEGTVRILDDDAGRLIVTSRDVAITEGNSGTRNATFEVTLSHAASVPVLVHYRTSDLTARAGSDYVAANSTLTFAPGDTMKTIVVPILGDTTIENDESFELQLGLDGSSMPSVRCTIRNDDAAPAPRKRAARH